MSRPIKFRAFWKEKNRMIHFEKVGYCDEYNHLSFRLRESDKEPEGGGYSNLCANIDDFSEIMQFTGMKDKNGKEIWEGDVLEICGNPARNGQKIVVSWNEEEAGFDPLIGYFFQGRTYLQMNPSKVIGNIYENPELLK